jgi:hypothetical protein
MGTHRRPRAPEALLLVLLCVSSMQACVADGESPPRESEPRAVSVAPRQGTEPEEGPRTIGRASVVQLVGADDGSALAGYWPAYGKGYLRLVRDTGAVTGFRTARYADDSPPIGHAEGFLWTESATEATGLDPGSGSDDPPAIGPARVDPWTYPSAEVTGPDGLTQVLTSDDPVDARVGDVLLPGPPNGGNLRSRLLVFRPAVTTLAPLNDVPLVGSASQSVVDPAARVWLLDGGLLRWRDPGEDEWSQRRVAPHLDYSQTLVTAGSSVGVVVSPYDRPISLHVSGDGGGTWRTATLPARVRGEPVGLPDGRLLVYDFGSLWRSTDATWQRFRRVSLGPIGPVAVAGPLLYGVPDPLLAAEHVGSVWVSYDAGSTWSLVASAAGAVEPTPPVPALDLPPDEELVQPRIGDLGPPRDFSVNADGSALLGYLRYTRRGMTTVGWRLVDPRGRRVVDRIILRATGTAGAALEVEPLPEGFVVRMRTTGGGYELQEGNAWHVDLDGAAVPIPADITKSKVRRGDVLLEDGRAYRPVTGVIFTVRGPRRTTPMGVDDRGTLWRIGRPENGRIILFSLDRGDRWWRARPIGPDVEPLVHRQIDGPPAGVAAGAGTIAVLGARRGLVSVDHGATWSSIDVAEELPSVREVAINTSVSTADVLRDGRLVVGNFKGTWIADDATNTTFHLTTGTVMHGVLVRHDTTTTTISTDGGGTWSRLTPRSARRAFMGRSRHQ